MDDVAAAASGNGNKMAIKIDGSLWVWGNNFYGFSYALYGSTEFWTKYNDMNVPVKVMDDVVAATIGWFSDTDFYGFFYTVTIKSDGSMWAWGYNRHGQLGDGTNKSTDQPVRIMDNMIAVAAGATVSVLPPPVIVVDYPLSRPSPPTGDGFPVMIPVFIISAILLYIFKYYKNGDSHA